VAQETVAPPVDSVSIRDQVGVLTRRWRIIVAVTILGVLAAGLYSHGTTKNFDSHAQVLVSAVSDDPFAASRTSNPSIVVMPTEQKIATSVSLANTVANTLGTGATGQQLLGHLKVTVPPTTQILDFSFTAPTAQAARAGADAFAHQYLTARHDKTAATITSITKSLQGQLSTLAKQRAALSARLSSIDTGGNAALNSEIGTLDAQIDQASQQLAALSTVDPTAASISQQATLPTSATAIAASILLAAGLAAGLVIGLICAFVADGLDDHLRGPGDLQAVTGVPVLARIPLLRDRPWRRVDLASVGTAHPKISEAYRHLASRLLVQGVGSSIKSILVASPAASDGRSSVAANLAAVYVDLGYRVWLVSADLAPPQVHTLMAPSGSSSLVSVLPITARDSASSTELEKHSDADPEGFGHLTLMSGTGSTRTAGRLMHPLDLARQIVHNQELADVTIIDAPPMLDYADAIPLIPVVHGVVVVADAGTTKRAELQELVELLDNSQAHIIGGVLNRDGSRVVLRRSRRARGRVAGLVRAEAAPTRKESGSGASAGMNAAATPSPTKTPAKARPRASAKTDAGRPSGAASRPRPAVDRRRLGWPSTEEPASQE
jgi:polysaccharide biosynthesis transport protein